MSDDRLTTLARRIVTAVEANLKNRDWLSWDSLEDEAAIEQLRNSVAVDVMVLLAADKAKGE